jgi:hypothetical protein
MDATEMAAATATMLSTLRSRKRARDVSVWIDPWTMVLQSHNRALTFDELDELLPRFQQRSETNFGKKKNRRHRAETIQEYLRTHPVSSNASTVAPTDTAAVRAQPGNDKGMGGTEVDTSVEKQELRCSGTSRSAQGGVDTDRLRPSRSNTTGNAQEGVDAEWLELGRSNTNGTVQGGIDAEWLRLGCGDTTGTAQEGVDTDWSGLGRSNATGAEQEGIRGTSRSAQAGVDTDRFRLGRSNTTGNALEGVDAEWLELGRSNANGTVQGGVSTERLRLGCVDTTGTAQEGVDTDWPGLGRSNATGAVRRVLT